MRKLLNITFAAMFLAITFTGQMKICVCLKTQNVTLLSCCCDKLPTAKNTSEEKDSCCQDACCSSITTTDKEKEVTKAICCEDKEISTFSQTALEKSIKPEVKESTVLLNALFIKSKTDYYTYKTPKFAIPYKIPPPGIKIFKQKQSYLC